MTSPAWLGGFQNLQREHGFERLEVRGELPPGLCGTLFRNGGGLFDRFDERAAHWFDNVAAVSAIRFGHQSCEGAVRLVRTEGFRREEQAGRRLFGGYNTPLARPAREMLLGDTSNPAGTSVMIHRGQLLALCEGGKPLTLDEELHSGSRMDLDGLVAHAFSAHPHRVESRRATYNFGLKIGRRTTVTLYELTDAGAERRLTDFTMDGPTMNHDFAVTERHAIFLFAPYRLRMLPILLGRKGPIDAAQWLNQPAVIVVVPLDSPQRHVRIEAPPQLLEHSVRAFELGNEIVVDYTRYENVRGREDFLAGLLDGVVNAPLGAVVERMVIDPARKHVRFERVFDEAYELPTIAPGDADPNTPAYAVGFSTPDAAKQSMFDCIARLELETGKAAKHCGSSSQFFGEPLCVAAQHDPKRHYLLSLVYDAADDASHVGVFDADHVGDGPLATVHFGQPIPFGFHGTWQAARHRPRR